MKKKVFLQSIINININTKHKILQQWKIILRKHKEF